MPTILDLQDSLGKLGRTQGEVAERLAETGCRGTRKQAGCCPVAVHLGKTLGGAGSYSVSHWHAYAPFFAGGLVMPAAVRDFIYAFDCGDYPELDAELGMTQVA